jgi:exodeoxyribonuclease-3
MSDLLGSMKIATFNINNVSRWLPNLLEWLKRSKPDFVRLQELKSADAGFPVDAIKAAGYAAVWQGQRTGNRVAILSRRGEPAQTSAALPGDPVDKEARYIEAAVEGILVCCLYLANGNPQPGPKFDYELAWFQRLEKHARQLLQADLPTILCGDFDVASTPLDIYPTTSRDDDVLVLPRAERRSRGSSDRDGRTPYAKSIRTSVSKRLDTICVAAGSATPAFGLTPPAQSMAAGGRPRRSPRSEP